MFRTATALALAAAFCGIANADDMEKRLVTAELTFDPTLLSSEAGVATTLTSITRQARRACRYVSLTSAGFSFDQGCVDSMVADAVEQIGHDALATAYADLRSEDTAS